MPNALVPGRVSIGIPTYNRPELAERAARSVLAQTYGDVELVVSDDLCPEDDSEERIEALRPLAGGKILRVIRQEQRLGLVGNFNACLELATGEFFLLLGDDDVLEPTAIARLAEAYLNPPAPVEPQQVGVAWCPCVIADASGGSFWTTASGPAVESPADLLTNLWAGRRGLRLSSILMRTAEARRVGGFEQRFGDLCDIGTWAQAALAFPAAVCVPDALVRYTNHQKSVTSQSSVADWQTRAYLVHDALLAAARQAGDAAAVRTIARARTDFLSGITLTIMMQTIGRPGWIGGALRETLRNPHIMLSPLMFQRAFKDGWKILRIRRQ